MTAVEPAAEENGVSHTATFRDRAATILVVEDGELHRYILEILFTEHGYHVLLCENAFEALDLVRSGLRPDLLVTDVGLPGINGLDLVRRLRATRAVARIPIIVRSATPGTEDNARTAGADAFLDKGEPVSRLLATVTRLLEATTAPTPPKHTHGDPPE